MTLNEVPPSTFCTITHVFAPNVLGQRLCDLGLCPGTDVYFVRKAPLNDPIHVRVGGYHVALRNSEAQQIQVKIHD